MTDNKPDSATDKSLPDGTEAAADRARKASASASKGKIPAPGSAATAERHSAAEKAQDKTPAGSSDKSSSAQPSATSSADPGITEKAAAESKDTAASKAASASTSSPGPDGIGKTAAERSGTAASKAASASTSSSGPDGIGKTAAERNDTAASKAASASTSSPSSDGIGKTAAERNGSAAAADIPAASARSTGAVGTPRNGNGSNSTAGHGRQVIHLGLLGIVLLLLVAFGAIYFQYQEFKNLQADWQRRQADLTQQMQESRDSARQALDLAQRQSARLEQLSNAVQASMAQLHDLDQALQTVSDRGTDLILLNDIERLLNIAQQQLNIRGNVANAIVSLESAQAQLARANRPALAALQQSINGDLDRLRAVQPVDVVALTGKLEQLSALLGSAPLMAPGSASGSIGTNQLEASPDAASAAKPSEPVAKAAGGAKAGSAEQSTASSETAAPASPVAGDDSPASVHGQAEAQPDSAKFDAAQKANATSASGLAENFWQNWQGTAHKSWLWLEDQAGRLAQDFRGLLDIRRIDDASALLLSPDQAQRLRESLQQRTVTAQLALMMHQGRIWQDELGFLAEAIGRRYDLQNREARQALRLAQELQEAPIETRLPGLANSLAAVEAAREEAGLHEEIPLNDQKTGAADLENDSTDGEETDNTDQAGAAGDRASNAADQTSSASDRASNNTNQAGAAADQASNAADQTKSAAEQASNNTNQASSSGAQAPNAADQIEAATDQAPKAADSNESVAANASSGSAGAAAQAQQSDGHAEHANNPVQQEQKP